MNLTRKFKLLETDFQLFYGAFLQQKPVTLLLVSIATIALDLLYAGFINDQLVIPILFILTAAAMIFWVRWVIRRRTRLTMEGNPLAEETITVMLTETLLRQRTRSGEVRVLYEDLYKVRKIRGLYIFYLTKDDVVLLPIRTLRRSDCKEIDELVKTKVKSKESFWRRHWLPVVAVLFLLLAVELTVLIFAGVFG